MWISIFEVVLKCLRLSHLIPFVRGLLHIGRPSEVHFPTELLGQGANLILSGLNNTMAFQSNPDWVWPMWYEWQKNPRSSGFIPTGMNLLTSNLSYRNWTSIGHVGSSREVMVDPVGMVTPQAFGYSLLAYIQLADQMWIPVHIPLSNIKQELLAGGIGVRTVYTGIPDMVWECMVMVKQNHEKEWLTIDHWIRAEKDIQAFRFGFSIRPYNSLSVAHVNSIEFFSLQNEFRINHQDQIYVSTQPDSVRIQDRSGPDPLFQNEKSALMSAHSKSGIMAGVCEWNSSLKQGQKKEWNIQIPMGALQNSSALPKLQRTASIQIPNSTWQQAWDAVCSRLHVFDDGSHYSPGTFLYHQFWLRDHAMIQMAFHQIGRTTDVLRKRDKILSVQRNDGYFCTQDGEWDSTGQAIYTLTASLRHQGDLDQIPKLWPAIFKGCEWIHRSQAQTQKEESFHKGLLPAGFSAEHFGPNDHYFWDAFWSLRALKDAQWIADIHGTQEQQQRVQRYAAELQTGLDHCIQETWERHGKEGLPSSPYRKMDASAIGNLVALSPLDLVNPQTAWVRQTVDFLWNHCLCQGMHYQAIIHTGLNAYLSIQLARALLFLNDSRWQHILNSVLEHASSTWTWPEAIHPGTSGGCMGDGDHGWAAAEIVSFILSVLVRVEEGELKLGHGIPEEWYSSSMNLGAKNVHTSAGIVSWNLKGEGDWAVFRWSIDRNNAQKKIPAYVQIPQSLGWVQPDFYTPQTKHSRLLLRKDNGEIKIPLKLGKNDEQIRILFSL